MKDIMISEAALINLIEQWKADAERLSNLVASLPDHAKRAALARAGQAYACAVELERAIGEIGGEKHD